MRFQPSSILGQNARLLAFAAFTLGFTGVSITARAQDADTDSVATAPELPTPAPQQSFDQQTYSYEPNLFNSAPIAGSSQSLLPIYYVPGLLDKSSSSTFLLNQTFSHNDNVFNLPQGFPPPLGNARADWYRTTTVGGTATAFAGAQRFYVNGTYSASRYNDDTVYNKDNYVLNAGWNWVFTARCSGTLVASDRLVQSPINLISSFTNNDIHTKSVNETAKCALSPYVNIIFDSGTSRSTNSEISLQANNADINFLRGGIEYNLSELDTLSFKFTPTKYDYFDRSPLLTPGLATSVKLTEYAVFYRRLFSPKLEFNGKFGLTEANSEIASTSSTESRSKVWLASLRWSPTSKISMTVLATQTVSPPQDIVADVQITRLDSFIVSYFFSPKLSFNAAVSERRSTYTTSGLAPGAVQSDQRSVFASFGSVYRITPFTSATASYSYTRQKNGDNGVQSGLETTANVFLLGLNYQR